jgi:integrin alpha FG-GAP repeat containing protein 1
MMKFAFSAIHNIIASDFNKDAVIDMIVQSPKLLESGKSVMNNSLFVGREMNLCSDTQFDSATQLLALDFDGDLRVDLLGNHVNGSAMIWRNVQGGECGVRFEPIVWEQLTMGLDPNRAHSFVDMDGDCLADLVIGTIDRETGKQYLEIWINQKGSWKLHPWSLEEQRFELPQGAGQVSFGDIDGDGNLDLVFPVCFPSITCALQNSIHVVYNIQKTICPTSQKGENCRDILGLCSADPNFRMGSKSSDDYIVFDLPSDLTLLTKTHVPEHEMRVQLGDVDLDGYPDILAFISYASEAEANSGVVIFMNVPSSSHKRWFSRLSNSLSGDLQNVRNVYAGNFIDIGQNGIPDLFLLSKDPENSEYSVKTFVNKLNIDAFFLKSMGSNGVCQSRCPEKLNENDQKVRICLFFPLLLKTFFLALWCKSARSYYQVLCH